MYGLRSSRTHFTHSHHSCDCLRSSRTTFVHRLCASRTCFGGGLHSCTCKCASRTCSALRAVVRTLRAHVCALRARGSGFCFLFFSNSERSSGVLSKLRFSSKLLGAGVPHHWCNLFCSASWAGGLGEKLPPIVQRIIPDEQPCFDLTQISTLISHLCAGLFSSISLLFAWRAVCVEFISSSPLNN